MANSDEEIELLTKLGLTSLQARVYLALDKIKIETAKGIANITEIDRANIYRILSSLQSIGLVEKKLTPGQSFFLPLTFKGGIN